MKKIVILFFASVFLLFSLVYLANSISLDQAKAYDDSDTVGLSVTVSTSLTLALSSNSVDLLTLTSGTPNLGPTNGLTATVTTNANNGYTLEVADASDTVSPLSLGGSQVTYIPDMTESAAVVSTPDVWDNGANDTGLGITNFSGDDKNTTTWGAGTTYNDALNKYRAIPATTPISYTASGYDSDGDVSGWSFEIDVLGTQQAGVYSTHVDDKIVFGATGNLL